MNSFFPHVNIKSWFYVTTTFSEHSCSILQSALSCKLFLNKSVSFSHTSHAIAYVLTNRMFEREHDYDQKKKNIKQYTQLLPLVHLYGAFIDL